VEKETETALGLGAGKNGRGTVERLVGRGQKLKKRGKENYPPGVGEKEVSFG